MPETLDHAAIEQLIPHRGPMCLLQRLERWDAAGIVCGANNHRDPRHPLRSRSGLLASASIEYAAQAMALHGALLGRAAGRPPAPGYLASARGVTLARWRLDDLPMDAAAFDPSARNEQEGSGADRDPGRELGLFPDLDLDELRIEAIRQAGDERQILYAFTLTHRGAAVAAGRAAVVLNTPIATP